MMKSDPENLQLSRGRWTLTRYLCERSRAPVPPVVRAGDDALHVSKLAVNAPLPRAVYVVDHDGRYLGSIPDSVLAREIFAHLDPGLYLEKHSYSKTALLQLGEDAARLTARALMRARPRPIAETETLAGAMRELYRTEADELPVTDAGGRLVGVIRALDILREWLEDTLLVRLGDETESFY